MFKKFGIGMLAAILAVAFSAFTTPRQAAPASTPNFDPPTYYWYHVNLATNKIDQDAQPFAIAEDVEGCETESDEVDCIRGFLVNPDTSEEPLTARGDVQKMTEEPQ